MPDLAFTDPTLPRALGLPRLTRDEAARYLAWSRREHLDAGPDWLAGFDAFTAAYLRQRSEEES